MEQAIGEYEAALRIKPDYFRVPFSAGEYAMTRATKISAHSRT